jgi:3-methyladenine DNA glycosylase/8-oxoguanine DNA glycosylase
MELCELLEQHGKLFSQELGIDVKKEPFKWFLASILFGARISTTIAKRTYKAYEEAGLTSASKIAASDISALIELHGRGGYARYDGITADYVIGIARKLLEDYDGNVTKLDRLSQNPKDLERRLQEFRGIGPVTSNIFLREMRGLWKNADPNPTLIEILAAKKLGIIESEENALQKLKEFWRKNKVEGYDFRNFEAFLVRIGLRLRRGKTS